jgi:hypothetical protein
MRDVFLGIYRDFKPWLIAIGMLFLLNLSLCSYRGYFQEPDIKRKTGEWNEARGKMASLGQGGVAAVYNRGVEDLAKFRKSIPSRREFPAILGEIMDSASSCGVTTGAISYKPREIKDRNLLLYDISLSVTGQYAGARCYLHKLRASEKLVVVNDIMLSNQDTYKENVSLELKMTVYLRNEA